MIGSPRAAAHHRRLLGGPAAGSVLAVLVALVVAGAASAATGWTGPTLIPPSSLCSNVAGAIDGTGANHVVAQCGTSVRYSTASDGLAWNTTTFAHPSDQEDLQPEIAIDGNTVYVAYSRNVPSDCGYSWAGVYVRQRTLPSGTWTAAKRIGRAGDHLQSLRVVGGVIHATVDNVDEVFYETYNAGTYHQYLISDAVGLTSLRIGSDGRARIAYEATSSLKYAVFSGGTFSKSSIPGTTADDRAPLLVLDANNRAHVVWSHESGPSCGTVETSADDGTYYATNKSGSWTAQSLRRFTTDLGATSMTLDTSTGRLHVLIGNESGLRYWVKTAGGVWSSQKLSSAAAWSTAIRVDQGSGRILAVYAREPAENASASVFTFTKP